MSKFLRNYSVIILAMMMFMDTDAQDMSSTSFMSQIKKYDLAVLLTPDSFSVEGGKEKIQRPEILGFIGNEYERLYVRFLSVVQKPGNPYEYVVHGKTMVKENIRAFHGTITVKRATIQESVEFPNYKQGIVILDVMLNEDKNQPATGIFSGKLTSNFAIDQRGKMSYDALMFYADDFSNNQFVGNWTSYKTGLTKKCNWGDYRIPESGDLDVGEAVFIVNEKYRKSGWLSYMIENMAPNAGVVKPIDPMNIAKPQWWE